MRSLLSEISNFSNKNEVLNPKVSVIVPAYNVEKYIGKCLNSLILQTLKDIEIIVINDGSKDSTLECINSFSFDKRIKVLNQENKGVSAARNAGMEIARGEFIIFIDSDDWVDKDYLEKLHYAASENECDIAVSSIIRKRKFVQKYRIYYSKQEIYSNLQEKMDACRIPACCYSCCRLYRASLIKNYKFKEGVCFEDVLWIPSVIARANKIVTVPGVNYYYRVNNCGIVKSRSLKNIKEAYLAKKNLIKFFDENNLFLSKKARNLTKEIKYFMRIPVLKIKEFNNIETKYLFGFVKLPISILKIVHFLYILSKKIFSISDIDSHKMIYIFGIHIRKRYKTNPVDIVLDEVGVNVQEQRSPRIIVSLTTFPPRINAVVFTIKTLLKQTLKPDEVVLWLAQSQFPRQEEELPLELLELRKYGLTIKWCEDIKSYKKLIPSLLEYPSDIIITFDDDIYYDFDVIEKLYNSYLEEPQSIHANRGHRVYVKNNILKTKSNAEIYWTRYSTSSFNNTIIGCGGVLYPPNSLAMDVTKKEIFNEVVPTQDDLWFWAMAVLNGVKIKIVSSYDMQIRTVENTQQYGLCKINSGKSGVKPIDSFKSIANKYPQILSIIDKNG